MVRPRPNLQLHDRPDIGWLIGGTSADAGWVAEQQRLTVWVIFGEFQAPPRRGQFTQGIAENGHEFRQDRSRTTAGMFRLAFQAVLAPVPVVALNGRFPR